MVPAPGCVQSDALQFLIELRQIGFAHPSQQHVLFDRGADTVAAESARNLRQFAHLPGREIAQRQRDGSDNVAFLLLAIDVRGIPRIKTFGPLLSVQVARRLQRFLGVAIQIRQIAGPSRIVRQNLSLFEHQPAELFDAQLGDQELDARLRAILLLTEPRKDAGNGLSDRQQFFFRKKRIEELRIVRHRAEPAADIEFEAAFLLAVFDARDGDGAHVVHVDQAAGFALRNRRMRS